MADSAIAQAIVSELPANIGTALALVPSLEWAKRSALPALSWINAKTAPLISVVAAALIAAGIHGTYDAHAGTILITGVTPIAIFGVLVEISKQWLGQHWIYKAYQGFDTLKSVAVALNQMAHVPTQSVTGAENGGKKP